MTSLTRNRDFNVAAPGANTNIITTSITPNQDGAFRVTICLTTASVFNVTITNGSTTFTCGLNESVTLQAGDLYSFVFGVSAANSYNFQVETDSVIRILQVDEIQSAVL